MSMNITKFISIQIGQSKRGLSDLLTTSQRFSKLPEKLFDLVFPPHLIYGTMKLLQMSRLPERSSLL